MAAHHEDLKVWQKAHKLSLEIYRLTGSFPREETYGLIAQIRRAAAAVATNIAEGAARQSRREFAQFVSIARGSASEVCDLLLLSKNLGYGDATKYAKVLDDYDHISRMLTKLLRSLREEQKLRD